MANLELLCFFEEEIGKGYHFNAYLVELTGKTKKQSSFKTKGYKIVDTFNDFEYLDSPKYKTVKRKVLFLQNSKMFKHTILLPKLPSRVLNNSYFIELQKQFGDQLDDYERITTQDVTPDKKNEFSTFFFHIDEFNNCLNKFLSKDIIFDEVIYLPSIYTNLVEKGMTYGIFYSNKMVKAFVANKKECIRNISLFDYDNIEEVEKNLTNIMNLVKLNVLYDKRVDNVDNVLSNIINFSIDDSEGTNESSVVDYPTFDFCLEAYYRDGNALLKLPTRKIARNEK